MHDNPKDVLVVGFGAGVTAGAISIHPTVERMVICELEPLIPKIVSQYFSSSQAWDFSEGIATACDDEGCNYINRNGANAIRNLKGALWPFSDGLAIVPADGKRQRYIDKNGRVIANYK